MQKEVHLELQPVMAPNGTWGPSGGSLKGVGGTPIPTKPPELLPQMIHALAEVHLHHNNNKINNNKSNYNTFQHKLDACDGSLCLPSGLVPITNCSEGCCL